MTQSDVTEFIDADPLDSMSPEAMLSLLVGDRATKLQDKAELDAVKARQMKIANAKPLNTALPPEEKLGEYWTCVHLGADAAGELAPVKRPANANLRAEGLVDLSAHYEPVPAIDPMLSNWYTGVLFEDAEGNFYKCTIATGVVWLHQSIFDGAFKNKALQHAVDVGVIELHPPGSKPNPRTFTKPFKDGWASGAIKLCNDSRTVRYIASVLGDRSAYTDALLKRAAVLESEGK